MNLLPPNAFTFSNYNADIPTGVYLDKEKLLTWLLKQNIIGYCKDPQFKPQDDYIAVLIDLEEHGEYWSHIPEELFNEYRNIIDNPDN